MFVDIYMTLSAQSHHIEPVFFGISLVMVIIYSLFATYRTGASTYRGEFPAYDCLFDGPCGSLLRRVKILVSSRCILSVASSLWRFLVSTILQLAPVGTVVTTEAVFAVVTQAIRARSAFPEVSCGFYDLAFVTSLRYDGLRHDSLLRRLLCSEPDAGHNLHSARFILLPPFSTSRRISYAGQ